MGHYATTEPEAAPVREHPGDRTAYEVFAEAMGWAAEWWELGTAKDIPGPGRVPFVLAFRHVREQCGGKPWEPSGVDHWGEWLRGRAERVRQRTAGKGERSRRRGPTCSRPAVWHVQVGKDGPELVTSP